MVKNCDGFTKAAVLTNMSILADSMRDKVDITPQDIVNAFGPAFTRTMNAVKGANKFNPDELLAFQTILPVTIMEVLGNIASGPNFVDEVKKLIGSKIMNNYSIEQLEQLARNLPEIARLSGEAVRLSIDIFGNK